MSDQSTEEQTQFSGTNSDVGFGVEIAQQNTLHVVVNDIRLSPY